MRGRIEIDVYGVSKYAESQLTGLMKSVNGDVCVVVERQFDTIERSRDGAKRNDTPTETTVLSRLCILAHRG